MTPKEPGKTQRFFLQRPRTPGSQGVKKLREVIRWKTIPMTWRRTTMSTKDQTMTKVPATMTFGSVFGVIKAPRWIAAVSLLLATAMPALAQCPPSFAAAANYAIGANPYSVAVGDFNADNRPDLAVTNFGTNNVSILLSSGEGVARSCQRSTTQRTTPRSPSRWATSTPTAGPTWPWRTWAATTSPSCWAT